MAIGATAVTLWSLETGRMLAELTEAAGPCAYLPDGKLVCTAKEDRKALHIWNLANGTKRRFAALDLPVLTLDISPNGEFYATSEGIWEVESKKQMTAFPLPEPLPEQELLRDEARLAKVAFSRNSRWCSMKRNSVTSPEIRVIDIATRREMEIKPSRPAVAELAFSSDSNSLVVLVIVFAWEFPSSKKWLYITSPEVFDLPKTEENQ